MRYEEWLNYCMTRAQDDWAGFAISDPSHLDRALSLPHPVLADFLARLMEESKNLAGYSREQIAKATWFLFGVGSSYFEKVRSSDVPPGLQLRTYAAVATIYTDLFDRLCGREATEFEADPSNEDDLDGAVYMVWDMGVISPPLRDRNQTPDLRAEGLRTLETILRKCVTPTCLKSALHGLGHLHGYARAETTGIIDDFLVRRGGRLSPWLREYAEHARLGGVQ